jgi:CheY-like chemotaxis protein
VCHVLIIEDEPIIAMDIEDMLAAEGATSFAFAASEEEAVISALTNPPAIITSDVNLTAGNGPHAIAAIHRRLGNIPVIFITSSPAQCSPCAPPGVVLSKPLNPGAIRSAFHQMAPSAPC